MLKSAYYTTPATSLPRIEGILPSLRAGRPQSRIRREHEKCVLKVGVAYLAIQRIIPEAIMYESSVIQHFAEQGIDQGRVRTAAYEGSRRAIDAERQ